MQKRKRIPAVCPSCCKKFFKSPWQIATACCSRSCATALANRNRSRPIGNGKGDDFTPFKWFLSHAAIRLYPSQQKRGVRPRSVSITLSDLKTQWEAQKGVCPYTGWKLLLPKNSSGWNGEKSTRRASLDRKDSSLGYAPGNVQFISIMANWAKNCRPEAELIEFCKAVAENGVRDGIRTHGLLREREAS